MHSKMIIADPVGSLLPGVDFLETGEGSFRLDTRCRIIPEGPGASGVGELFAEYLGLGQQAEGPKLIRLVCQKNTTVFPDESYQITISPEQVLVAAPEAAGLARAIQTMRQLLPPECLPTGSAALRECDLPVLRISDHPAFPWRGMHLDVARHFFGVEDVCRFIDLIALHRFNRLHLHLTDDQGWRIEIKKYPRLTAVGGQRPCTLVGRDGDRPRRYDEVPHTGWFTQEDIRRIVEFAARRHVSIIPEIDLPGHMMAAICAYPELGNGYVPQEPLCHWGISPHILNAEPQTLRFLEEVLAEVVGLFPDTFVHLGGDEVPTTEWEHSRRIQERLTELGLRDERALQRWFIDGIRQSLAPLGRRLVAWDEILESSPTREVVVMAWRGERFGAEAARRGHDVVMAPTDFTYFDFYQADPISEEPIANGRELTVSRVYAFDPIPHELEEEFHPRILGSQGQLWTEYIATRNHLDYMAFPRACALAEVLWLHRRRGRFLDFRNRLDLHRQRLGALGVHAHPRP